MKHLFHHLPKLAAVAAIALSMSSCNRAEYAMLPKTTPYHATYHGTAKPAPAPVAQQEEMPAAKEEIAAAEEKNVVEAPAAVAATPAPAVAATPAAKPAATPAPAKTIVAASKPAKFSLVQKAALAKINKKAEKIAQKMTRNHGETASANAISANLKLGIILLLVGALVTILPGGIFDVIGGIIAIIGLVFIILALLDMA